MDPKHQLTQEEQATLKRIVEQHPELVAKLRKTAEGALHDLKAKNPNGIQIKPGETAIASIASIASRLRPGKPIADIDTGEIVFVGACVFVA